MYVWREEVEKLKVEVLYTLQSGVIELLVVSLTVAHIHPQGSIPL